MKKLTIVLFLIYLLICLFGTYALSNDLYGDVPDNSQDDQEQWNKVRQKNNQEEERQREQQQQTIINGQWDTQGNHYHPADSNNNNKWRQDGTFMQKVAGGYIDTKTGRFIPSTE